MIFARKRNEYKVEYTKAQAKKLLLQDERIDKITMGIIKMIVVTKPFIPKGFEGDSIFIYPVGTYKITLTKMISKIGIKIVRMEGYVQHTPGGNKEWYTPHINRYYYSEHGENGICWGSILEEMRIMQENKDWYWIVKRCLELINDFSYYTRYEDRAIRRFAYMVDYVGDDEKARRRIEKKLASKKYSLRDERGRKWLFN